MKQINLKRMFNMRIIFDWFNWLISGRFAQRNANWVIDQSAYKLYCCYFINTNDNELRWSWLAWWSFIYKHRVLDLLQYSTIWMCVAMLDRAQITHFFFRFLYNSYLHWSGGRYSCLYHHYQCHWVCSLW